MEYIYCFIEEYRSLKNCEFNFGGPIRCSFDFKRSKLNIEDDPDYIPDFFGEQIINVSAIVGRNGSGKSALLEWLMGIPNGLIKDNGKYCIVLYNRVTQEVLIKHNFDENPVVSGTNSLKNKYFNQEEKSGYNEHDCIVYFTNSIYDRMPLTFPFSDVFYNASIKAQFEYVFSNEEEIKDSLVGLYKKYEYQRLLNLIRSQIDISDFFPLPKYLSFTIEPLPSLRKPYSKPKILSQIVTHFERVRTEIRGDKERFLVDMERLIVEYWVYSYGIEKFEEYYSTLDDIFGDVPGIFLSNMNTLYEAGSELYALFDALSKMLTKDGIVFHDEFALIPLADFNPESLDYIFDSMRNIKYDIASLLKFGFSFSNRAEDEFSSGEFAFLSMLARLYAFNTHQVMTLTQGVTDNVLVIIDEGELYLHPSWQKKFVNLIVGTLPQIYPNVRIQVLLTSHSPFILSDLPKNKVTFLRKDKGRSLIDKSMHHAQTFAGNIHTLLADSFFMEDGFIGEFAEQKLNQVIKELQSADILSATRWEQIRRIITSVGEPVIRAKMLDLYESKQRLDNSRFNNR